MGLVGSMAEALDVRNCDRNGEDLEVETMEEIGATEKVAITESEA